MHSQCIIPNNDYNLFLNYQWKQLFVASSSSNTNISNQSISLDQNAKILLIRINQLDINTYYLFELSVSEQNTSYKSTKEVIVYTELSPPIPLSTTIQTIPFDDNYELIIDIYDLYYFPLSQFDQDMYKIKWVCFENVVNPTNCSQIIKKNNYDHIIVDTISLL